MVNTFLPYSDFRRVAHVLDNKRLGKQRVEAKQIINILCHTTKAKGFRNHPAVYMWRGYTDALKLYYNIMIDEWIRRGFVNNMPRYKLPPEQQIIIPWFVRCKQLLLSHRAALLRKLPSHYKRYFKKIPAEYMMRSYVWISHLNSDMLAKLSRLDKKSRLISIQDLSAAHVA
jgi:hypothetical protein